MHEAAMAMFHPTAEELRRRSDARTEIVARDDRLLSAGPLLEHPWSSQVHWVRWTEPEAEGRITEVLEFFRVRRQAFVWLVTARSAPASLRDRLAARGLIRELEGRMLATALPIVGLRVNPEIRVEEVTNRTQMLAALRVDHPTWDDARLASLLDDRMRRLGTNWHAAVAHLDGRTVGTARWFIHADLGGVDFAGAETLVAYRGRGVYSTLVAYRADRAAREGCTFAGIIADGSTSAPILQKRGFEDLGRATFFLSPVPPA
jgi:GNAT superfamily N-acetyltransferase